MWTPKTTSSKGYSQRWAALCAWRSHLHVAQPFTQLHGHFFLPADALQECSMQRLAAPAELADELKCTWAAAERGSCPLA